MERFDPAAHIPATEDDRLSIEKALMDGWELMVDREGNVQIEGEYIAMVDFR